MSNFDWNGVVKPLLSIAYGSCSQNVVSELYKLAKKIVEGRKEVLEHDQEHDQFYSTFIALFCHFVSSDINSASHAQLPVFIRSADVAIEYILAKLAQNTDCGLSKKQIILLLKGLVKGLGLLQRSSDILSLAAQLKQNPPAHIRPSAAAAGSPTGKSTGGSSGAAGVSDSGKVKKTSSAASSKESVASLVDAMMTPDLVPRDAGLSKRKDKSSGSSVDETPRMIDCSTSDVKLRFAAENIRAVREKGGADVLLNLCMSLPSLGPAREVVSAIRSGSPVKLMSDQSEADQFRKQYQALLTDVATLYRVVTMHIFEPLNQERLEMMQRIAQTAAVQACFVASAEVVGFSTADHSDSSQAQNVVDKCISVLREIKSVIENSHWAGGAEVQDFRCLTATVMLRCFDSILAKPDKNRSLTLICLSNELLSFVEPIILDARVHVSPGGKRGTPPKQPTKWLPASATALDRFMLMNTPTPFTTLLVQKILPYCLAEAKAVCQDSQVTSGNAGSADEGVGVDGSSADSGSEGFNENEPLLGNWLEEVLASAPLIASGAAAKDKAGPVSRRRRSTTALDCGLFGDKSEMQACTTTIKSALRLFSVYLTSDTGKEVLGLYQHWMNREFVVALGNFLKEAVSPDAQALNVSRDVQQTVHNLIANGYLNEQAQNLLLATLGLAVGDPAAPWPLQTSPQFLAVLCQSLLLRQSSSEEETKSPGDILVVQIWKKFMNSLVSTCSVSELEPDANVEHIQLLLFLFHTLQLMQKKLVFLDVAASLVALAKACRESQTNTMNGRSMRIIAIFEYMVRYFYDPPAFLLQQMKTNLLSVGQAQEGTPPPPSSVLYERIGNLDTLYTKYKSSLGKSAAVKLDPFFYSLTTPEESDAKLDGLGMNFLQNSGLYSDVYRAVLTLAFSFGHALETRATPEMLIQTGIAFTVRHLASRLARLLPPSVEVLSQLSSADPESIDDVILLHSLLLSSKLLGSGGAESSPVRDSVMKQGLSKDKAVELLETTDRRINGIEYILCASGICLNRLLAKSPKLELSTLGESGPSPLFFDSVAINMVVNRLSAVATRVVKDSENLDAPGPMQYNMPIAALVQCVKYMQAYVKYLVLLKTLTDESSLVKILPKDTARKENVPLVGNVQHFRAAALELLAITSRQAPCIGQLTCEFRSLMPSALLSAASSWHIGLGDIRKEFASKSAWSTDNSSQQQKQKAAQMRDVKESKESSKIAKIVASSAIVTEPPPRPPRIGQRSRGQPRDVRSWSVQEPVGRAQRPQGGRRGRQSGRPGSRFMSPQRTTGPPIIRDPRLLLPGGGRGAGSYSFSAGLGRQRPRYVEVEENHGPGMMIMQHPQRDGGVQAMNPFVPPPSKSPSAPGSSGEVSAPLINWDDDEAVVASVMVGAGMAEAALSRDLADLAARPGGVATGAGHVVHRTLKGLVAFLEQVVCWEHEKKLSVNLPDNQMANTFIQITAGSATEGFLCSTALEHLVGRKDSERFAQRLYEYALDRCLWLVGNWTYVNDGSVEEPIILECFKLMEIGRAHV